MRRHFSPRSAMERRYRNIWTAKPCFHRAELWRTLVFYIQQEQDQAHRDLRTRARKPFVHGILEPAVISSAKKGCLNGHPLHGSRTAQAVDECLVTRIGKAAMIAVMHDEPDFSGACYMAYLLTRNSRIEEDLIDQVSGNSSEKASWRACSFCSPISGQGGHAGADRRKIQPGDARRDGRDHEVAREHVHEQVPQAGLYGQVQWKARNP